MGAAHKVWLRRNVMQDLVMSRFCISRWMQLSENGYDGVASHNLGKV